MPEVQTAKHDSPVRFEWDEHEKRYKLFDASDELVGEMYTQEDVVRQVIAAPLLLEACKDGGSWEGDFADALESLRAQLSSLSEAGIAIWSTWLHAQAETLRTALAATSPSEETDKDGGLVQKLPSAEGCRGQVTASSQPPVSDSPSPSHRPADD